MVELSAVHGTDTTNIPDMRLPWVGQDTLNHLFSDVAAKIQHCSEKSPSTEILCKRYCVSKLFANKACGSPRLLSQTRLAARTVWHSSLCKRYEHFLHICVHMTKNIASLHK